ncbi:DUF2294 domain-containing protein [Capilliphycus salinus ALCB114379]|uniref:DUF2294 domain-containing protein n=1 Tax=Capilliphycus salinus TaxID=2768948 RepID=UPI0039A65B8D
MKTNNFESSEQVICERIRKIYVQQLDHQLSRISCRIFDQVLVLILEGVITPPEQLLNQNNHLQLVSQVRAALDGIIQPKIQNLIEQTLNVTVTDFLCDTAIETSRTGAIVIFEIHSRRDSSKLSSNDWKQN